MVVTALLLSSTDALHWVPRSARMAGRKDTACLYMSSRSTHLEAPHSSSKGDQGQDQWSKGCEHELRLICCGRIKVVGRWGQCASS